MKITLKRSLMAMMCVVGMSSFVACDDDEVLTPPVVLPTAENGSYEGNMSYAMSGSISTPEAVTFEMVQSNIGTDSLVFAKFPVKSLVTAIMGEGDGTDDLLALIGDVKYVVDYTAKATTDGMDITFAPKALELNIEEIGKVIVSVEAVGTGKYVTASKEVTFSLKATKVTLGGTEVPNFKAITLNFKATKK